MAEPASPLPRPVGALLGESFSLFWKGLGDAAAIVAAAMTPGALLIALGLWLGGLTSQQAIRSAEGLPPAPALALLGLGFIAMIALYLVSFVALVTSVAARAEGRPQTWDESIRLSLGRVVPMVWAGAIAGLFCTLGFIALVLPGVYLAVRYSLVHVAVIVEGREGLDALNRSAQLVAGRFWRVLGLLLAGSLVVSVAALAVGGALSAAFAVPQVLLPPGLAFWWGQASGLVSSLIEGLLQVWMYAYSVLLFKDLAATAAPAAAGSQP